MTKQVRCISPHGGGHNGFHVNGLPVHPVPDGKGGFALPDIPPEKMALPPNEGGYIDVPSLGQRIAVGSVVDVPDDWEINEFHFEWVTPPDAPQPEAPAPAPAPPAEGE